MSKVIYFLSGPHINVETGYWLFDYLVKDGYIVKTYYLYKYGHYQDFSTRLHKFTRAINMLWSSHKGDTILLYDVTSVFIITGLMIKFFNLKRYVVAINFMGSGNKLGYDKWKRPLVSIGLNAIQKIGVNNESLIDLYSYQLKINKDRFFVIEDCASNVDINAKDCTPKMPPYVFTGGNVHRDWKLFKIIVRELPEINFVAVSGGDELDDVKDLKNLTVLKNIPLNDFNELIAHSTVVFVPLTTELQAGQLVAFQGAMYKKPVIITRCLSIDSYYDDDEIIKVNIGDIDSCKKSIQILLSDNKLCKTLGDKGYNRISKLTSEFIFEKIKSQINNKKSNYNTVE